MRPIEMLVPDISDYIEEKRCYLCKKEIKFFPFGLYEKEFNISAMCPRCQLKVFEPKVSTSTIYTREIPYLVSSRNLNQLVFRVIKEEKDEIIIVPRNVNDPGDHIYKYKPSESDGTDTFRLEDETLTKTLTRIPATDPIVADCSLADKCATYIILSLSANEDYSQMMGIVYRDKYPEPGNPEQRLKEISDEIMDILSLDQVNYYMKTFDKTYHGILPANRS